MRFKLQLGGSIKLMNKILSKILSGDKICLVDVGASGGVEPRWAAIKNMLSCILFEPDERSFEDLQPSEDEITYPYIVGDKTGEKAFYLCRKPQVSSGFKPNADLLSRFPEAERYDVIEKETFSCSTLDHIIPTDTVDVDFIKLDVQGAEAEVISGAQSLLQGPVIGVEAEVWLSEVYKEQPLLGDISALLTSKGFEFYDFTNILRWERDQFTRFGQNVMGDVLFLKTPERFAEDIASLSPEQAQRKARRYIVVCALYDRVDLMPVCKKVLSAYFDTATHKLIDELEVWLLSRRKKVNIALVVIDHFLHLFGYRAMPVQWK